MAKIKKKSQKTMMQREEEIKSIAHHVVESYQAHRNQYNTAMTVVAIAIVVMITMSLISANKEKKAGQLLDAAYQAAESGGAASGNYQLALQRFQDVIGQYGGTLSGAVAQYAIGNTYARMGQYEQALQEYDKFLKRYGKEKFVLPFVYQRTGYAYLALGKQDEAAKAFSKAEASGGPGPATVELARIYDRAGNAAEAQKMYKEVSEKLSGTAWAVEARTKLPPPVLTSPATVPARASEK